MHPLTPKQHQDDAVKAVVSELVLADRTSVIMPCGTGKTMVGQLIAEALQCAQVVLLFPSIALIRQTLVFWQECGMLSNTDCLCVCSDKTVANRDEVVVTEEDIGMHITTSATEVLSFFQKKQGRKVVFCTYHSTPILGAGMPQGMQFDLGIFDEAHRTASSNDSAFSFALDDQNLPIRKRVFMTATPRHQVDGESAYSMDDESIYGKRSYVLPFRKAIEDDLICDYKVLISTVTSREVADHLASEIGKTKGGVNAKLIAASIAIKKAMDTTGATKAFAFHGTVAEAELFASMPATIREAGCDMMHVSGAMSMKKRDQIVNDFRKSSKAVLTNARCLTEGIDVPAVDMVAFIDPKRSIVDIVQAVGRGLRKAPGKQFGYILLPVYVDLESTQVDDITKLVSKGQMRHIWSVLANMAEQESMVSLSNSAGMAKVRAARRARIPFEVVGDPKIVATLRHEIDVFYANSNQHGFEENFEEYVKAQKETGSANPSVSQNRKMANWARHLRYKRSIGELSEEKIALLDSIGFAWNGRDPLWMAKFEDFKAGKKNYRWEAEQRKRYREGVIDEDRKALLTEAGFDFEPGFGRPLTNEKAAEAPKQSKPKKASLFDTEWDAAMREDGSVSGNIQVLLRACGIRHRALPFVASSLISDGLDPIRGKKTGRSIGFLYERVGDDNFALAVIAYTLRLSVLLPDNRLSIYPVDGLNATDDVPKKIEIDSSRLITPEEFSARRSAADLKKELSRMKKNGMVFVPFDSTSLDLWLYAAGCVCCQVAAKKASFMVCSGDEKKIAVANEMNLSVEMPNGNILTLA